MTTTNELFALYDESNSPIRFFRRVPLSALRIFEAAGRSGSFAAAAEEVGLSRSAVSHAIKKLEEAAGLALFIRTTRAITLTPEGRLMLEHVQRGFDEMQKGFQQLRPELREMPLRLHTAPTFGSHWLMPRLARFVAEHPGINLRFSADTRYAQFDNDDYDIDVVYGQPAPSKHETIPLVIEELTPLCSPALAPSIRSVQDLYSNPLIQSTGQSVQWRGWFQANHLRTPTEYALAFDRSGMAIAAAVDGLGVVLESSLLTERERAAGTLVAPLRDQTTAVRYVGHYLVHPKGAHGHAAVVQFKSWLLTELDRGR